MNSCDFIHIFRNFRQFSTKSSPILLNFDKIKKNLKNFDLIVKDKKNILGYFYLFFFVKNLANYVKIQSSSSKTASNKFL